MPPSRYPNFTTKGEAIGTNGCSLEYRFEKYVPFRQCRHNLPLDLAVVNEVSLLI